MKKQIIILGSIALLFLVIFFSLVLIPNRTIKYDMDINVSTDKIIGFNVGTDAVHFGKVPSEKATGRSADAIRELTVNSGDSDVKVTIKTSGDMGSWVTIEPNEFYLNKNQSKVVELTARVPYYVEPGFYTGKVIVTLVEK